MVASAMRDALFHRCALVVIFLSRTHDLERQAILDEVCAHQHFFVMLTHPGSACLPHLLHLM